VLEKLSVRNLGPLHENVRPASFSQETVLIGPNNSGKSTFIAGLNLLRVYSIVRRVDWSSTFYNFVNWREAVHNHDDKKIIQISATLDSMKYDLAISVPGNIRRESVSDGTPIYEVRNKDRMRKIWYLRPNRSLIPYRVGVGINRDELQPSLSPSGSDVINFLLERFTERDTNWDIAEEWFTKIDPEISSIRTPIRRSNTFFETLMRKLAFNASLQGSGFHSVASVIAAVVFSPKGATVVIEEPEICLHKRAQEAVVDLFNDAVVNQGKQIIFSTHSWDMLLPFISDVGRGTRRGRHHVHADPEKFTLLAFNKSHGLVNIEPMDIRNMKVYDVKRYLKKLWG